MPVLLLFLIYFNLSILGVWDYGADWFAALGYLLLIGGGFFLFIKAIIRKEQKIDLIMVKRLFAYALISVVLILWSGEDFSRRAELAFKPQQFFDYPDPQITATITAPLYLNRDTISIDLSQNIYLQSGDYQGLNPVYEGSVLDVHVKNTKWKPTLGLSDGQSFSFEQQEDGSFKASAKIAIQDQWQVRQGLQVIGSWPIILIEDQAPRIVNFTIENSENEKGYLALNVDVDDDYKIIKATLEAIAPDGVFGRQDLSIHEIKSYQNVFYIDMTKFYNEGQKVDVKLSIEDEAGQISSAVISNVTLPHREFNNGIAQKLVSLRNQLNKSDYDLNNVSRQLKALGLLSDNEGLPPVYYMALRSAYWRLVDPTAVDDVEIAKDMLWDIALKIEGHDISLLENSLIFALDDIILAIKQKKSVMEIREELRSADALFRLYSSALIETQSPQYSLDIDIRSIRKLYSYILAFSDQEKFYNAAIITDFMRKGLVHNDDLILSKEGLSRYFALTEGRKIIDNLILIQKSLLANSYDQQMKENLFLKSTLETSVSEKKTQEHIKLQTKIGDAVKMLGEKISFTGFTSDFLIQNATSLVEEIIANMKISELNQVTQSQSELISIMSSLKRILNKPVAGGEELQNILQEINAGPVS